MRDFRSSGFDPRLIIGQIAGMQALMYLGFGAWLMLFNGLAGRPATTIGLEHIFSAPTQSFSYPGGTVTLAAYFINALAGGCFLCVIVERAKKCLDFTVTSYLLHLCGCAWYESFPDRWEWWAVTIANVVAMSLLGEYLCMRREMQEIPLFQSGR